MSAPDDLKTIARHESPKASPSEAGVIIKPEEMFPNAPFAYEDEGWDTTIESLHAGMKADDMLPPDTTQSIEEAFNQQDQQEIVEDQDDSQEDSQETSQAQDPLIERLNQQADLISHLYKKLQSLEEQPKTPTQQQRSESVSYQELLKNNGVSEDLALVGGTALDKVSQLEDRLTKKLAQLEAQQVESQKVLNSQSYMQRVAREVHNNYPNDSEARKIEIVKLAFEQGIDRQLPPDQVLKRILAVAPPTVKKAPTPKTNQLPKKNTSAARADAAAPAGGTMRQTARPLFPEDIEAMLARDKMKRKR